MSAENTSAPPTDTPEPNPAMVAPNACKATRVDGTPCRALAMLGESYCFWHGHPERAADARRKGTASSAARKNAVIQTDKVEIDDPETLKRVLSAVIGGLKTGQLAPPRANALISALRVGLSLAEIGALEKRIKALEEKDAQ